MTTGTLIALVDASAYAESVCHHAGWIARRAGWSAKVYHVMGRRAAADSHDLSGAIRLGARSALLEDLARVDAERARLAQEHGRAILEDARAIIAGPDGAVAVETRLRQGDLVETVTAKENTGEMIVIGKRGEAAGLARAHLGSNLERILRAAHKPVFIANRAFAPIERVLVAFDGGASALKAVEFVATSPLFQGLSVTLIHAGRETEETRAALGAAAARIDAAGRPAEIVIRQGEPEDVLAEETALGRHGLLVMGAYAHSRVRALFIGSTTSALIRACPVPVLVMR